MDSASVVVDSGSDPRAVEVGPRVERERACSIGVLVQSHAEGTGMLALRYFMTHDGLGFPEDMCIEASSWMGLKGSSDGTHENKKVSRWLMTKGSPGRAQHRIFRLAGWCCWYYYDDLSFDAHRASC